MNLSDPQFIQIHHLLWRCRDTGSYTLEEHKQLLQELEGRYQNPYDVKYRHHDPKLSQWAFVAITTLAKQLLEIESFVKYHRDQKRDDRCWGDDAKLYALVLGDEDWKPELMPKAAFLENCSHYWECQARGLPYHGKDSGALLTQPDPPRCRVPWFCDQRPDESGLCQFHRCNVKDCTNYRHQAYGMCLAHCAPEIKARHEAEERRRAEDSL